MSLLTESSETHDPCFTTVGYKTPRSLQPAFCEFDEAFWPAVFNELHGKKYDHTYFKLCTLHPSTLDAVKAELDPRLHYMLDDIQRTVRRSAVYDDSPLSVLLEAYDNFYDSAAVDGRVLIRLAEHSYGELLNHNEDVEADKAIEPNVAQPAVVPGLATIDNAPIYARSLAVSGIRPGTTLDALVELLTVALDGYPVHFTRLRNTLQSLEFLATLPFGNQFTVMVPLVELTAFFNHPVQGQLGVTAVRYGPRQPLVKGKTYAVRVSVQIASTADAAMVQCARPVAALAWGSDGPISEQLQHQVLSRYLSTTLNGVDQAKLVFVTARALLFTRESPATRMSVSAAYLLPPHGPEEIKRLSGLLFAGKQYLTTQGICFAVFATPVEALYKRPSCRSLTVVKPLTISGLRNDVNVEDVLQVCVRSGALSFRAQIQLYTIRNTSAVGKELQYLIVLGSVTTGPITYSHPIFRDIATKGTNGYDIHVKIEELFGQIQLRSAHQEGRSLTASPATPPVKPDAMVKRNPIKQAWSTSTLESYRPPEPTQQPTSLQVTNTFREQAAAIRKLEDTMAVVRGRLDEQSETLKCVVTLTAMEEMFTKFLGKSA